MEAIYYSFGDALAFNPLVAPTTIAWNWWNDQPLLSNPVTGARQTSMAISPLMLVALGLGGYLLWKAVK